MTPAQKAGTSLGAVLTACGMAAALLVGHEGWLTKSYADPVQKPTACAGVTEGVKLGQTYTDAECEMLTGIAMVKHGVAIDRCIRVSIPLESRAAFTDFAYNVGVANFCGSTLARKVNAGDLAGACAELSRWTYAGGKQLPGLVRRRADERALCERGIAGAKR